MVAYSCQKQFVPDIEAGWKTHTIRGPRKRHAKVGEPIQLYTAMRTKHCRKIIADPVCTFVDPISILFAPDHVMVIWIGQSQVEILDKDFDQFARMDGFNNIAHFSSFWDRDELPEDEGLNSRLFQGFIVGWGFHPLNVLYPALEYQG